MLCLLLAAAVCAPARGDLKLPPVPENKNFVQDLADMPIERFAFEWFNHWQIGKRGEAGELVNQGILLLVSRNDRKARIELGAAWGRRWDAHAARIMQDRVISRFKQDRYAEGITAGVEALLKMAEQGPEAEPPGTLADFLPGSLTEKALPTSPLPGGAIIVMLIVGFGLCVLAVFLPAYRKWLLIGGLGLIVSALLFWVVLVIAGLFLRSKTGVSGGSSRGGGGFSSGGGFSTGGFSGGGGATGSW